MKVFLQAMCVALIAAASVLYMRGARPLRRKATRGQYMLVFFQIILCGSYFALCLSDYLFARAVPDQERMISDMIFLLMFLALGVYALFLSRLNSDLYIRGTLAILAALTAAQCFVFPDDASGTGRVAAGAVGALTAAALIVSLLRIRSASFVQKCMIGIIALELSLAVWNVFTAARLSADEPRRYAAFFMRTALFSTLALAYRVWLDRRGIPAHGEKPAAP